MSRKYLMPHKFKSQINSLSSDFYNSQPYASVMSLDSYDAKANTQD